MPSGIVIKSIAPLKQKPSMDSELADEILFGMEVELLEEIGDWIYVNTFYGYLGYLNKNDLLAEGFCKWGNLDKQYIISAFADVLCIPSYSSDCLVTIPRGARLALTGDKTDKWVGVMLPAGERGWVREEDLQEINKATGSTLRQSIVDTALLYLGTQYRLGGKSPMGIDCAGLTSMTYLINGIVIPRDSDNQRTFLQEISRKESRPGDLLFFPGHVAIYIGEDKFVHATGMDARVKINSLNKDSKLYRKDLDEKYISSGTVF